MEKFKIFLVAILLSPFLFQSCQKEDVTTDNNSQIEEEATTDKLKVTDEMLQKLSDFYLNTDGVKVVDFLLPDGTTTPMIQVEEDLMFTEEQIMQLDFNRVRSKGSSETERNYHTNNLVSQGKNISIIGFTGGGGYGLSPKEQNALQMAVNNYNSLSGVSISFTLTFGTNYGPKDMVVYNNPFQFGSGGSAGFPSASGNPYKFVQIFGLNSFNVDVIEHVITHEIGHSVGFRHTDWQTRQSCGQNINEGLAGVGANAIPGTSAGYNPNSIMLACFNSSVDGEFDADDIIGLQYMY
ncbi:M57 family metalloprotease [Flavivirga eckloniae]|uniref:Peptidase n=1 Tax=Flavivirga eckloniae TaxID=1803846 RepID=A0A2K9PUZ7_9FLAO|nr:M57 family metalloprotease [Flavivirga eckloniae]AUP80896.1 peptidase [Flavivirga eckloniae]